MKTPLALAVALWALPLAPALAADAAPVQGLWLTADQGAAVKVTPCADNASALCGTIVWDKDAGKASDTCGTRVFQMSRDDGGTWRDGWVFDPRDGKKYKGYVRRKGDDLNIRAYVGTEVLGKTEQLTPLSTLPATPHCS
ncbi:DUF2147 domain-containing protein [Pseudomonas sp. HR1]|uniref:Uncharacterized conserved protein, DUF2147 family n=1 Tax=Pseudomonas oryzihabitans TaxID=47885 RepID=A0A1G5M6A9_9PSED|nr:MULTISPECIES: DUF2147 domain-containing protein [Pseudomonas]MDK4199221.1 DUF2147 domain-containing protein [Pseudomonas sp. HR1]NMY88702.1 DUF2147 domain-containing protein [Pseudomonas psychrotolerans]SCZ20747.1 Uncharacterized conserved protein, DUF2147 family [Pseudomonas psychrotolerans]